MPDLELTRTIAGSAEELGYASVWTNDAPPGDGIASVLAMLGATEKVRVGVGAVPFDRRRVDDVVAQLTAGGVALDRLVLVVGAGFGGTLASTRQVVSDLRAGLGPGPMIGVAALGPKMCRLGGEIADLVLLNWMNPERIVWARGQVGKGLAERRAGLRAAEPELAAYIRLSIGDSAALRIAREASMYRQMPQYARNFEAQGVRSVGIAAVEAEAGPGLVEPYEAVLDEAILRVIATLPSSPNPEMGEAFEALAVVMEAATRFAPAAPPREDATT
ncbi:MAG TPA: LLM class flavin-dependent oxidoreductase [Actinomycetota bacterium]|nr:LLM class flavin-dependent oxidoreductase [Actinomycetota bacterium]